MDNQRTYPRSFPNAKEQEFLTLVTCNDTQFLSQYKHWISNVDIDRLDYATTRLLPLLSRRLRQVDYVDHATPKIHGLYKLALVKNQRLLHALGTVVPLLEAHDIQVLLLKGAPLLLTAYQDIGARFMGDADILIHPRFAKTVIHVLLAADWKLTSPFFPRYETFTDQSFQRVVKEATFTNEQQIDIDIHWRLFDFFEEAERVDDFDTLWKQASLITYKDKTYRSLSPEDMLLHVIVHGAEGNVHRTLRWVTDAAVIMKTMSIDWSVVLEHAQQNNWVIELFTACKYLSAVMHISIPTDFLHSLEALPISSRARNAYNRKANATQPFFGRLPLLSRVYWRYEKHGIFPVNLFSFLKYLTHAWGFSHVYSLIPFIFNKYKARFLRSR